MPEAGVRAGKPLSWGRRSTAGWESTSKESWDPNTPSVGTDPKEVMGQAGGRPCSLLSEPPGAVLQMHGVI